MQNSALFPTHSHVTSWVVIPDEVSKSRAVIQTYSQSSQFRKLTALNYTLPSKVSVILPLQEKIEVMTTVETKHKIAFALLVIATIMTVIGFIAGATMGARPLGILFPVGLFVWAVIGYAYPKWLAK